MDKIDLAVPEAKWLSPLIFSALNRPLSHLCVFETSSGHI